MKPFRFGVNVWGARSGAEWADKARRVEGLGYSTLTSRSPRDSLSTMPALLAAPRADRCARHQRAQNDLGQPVVAREAATVDFSGGALPLGSAPAH